MEDCDSLLTCALEILLLRAKELTIVWFIYNVWREGRVANGHDQTDVILVDRRTHHFYNRAVKQLISLTALIVQFIFFNCTLIAVLTYILFITFFDLFAFHLQLDIVGPLLLNASLPLVLTI